MFEPHFSDIFYFILILFQNFYFKIFISKFLFQNFYFKIFISKFLFQNFYFKIFISKFLFQNFYFKIFISKFLFQNFYFKIFISKFLFQNFYFKIFISYISKLFTANFFSIYSFISFFQENLSYNSPKKIQKDLSRENTVINK